MYTLVKFILCLVYLLHRSLHDKNSCYQVVDSVVVKQEMLFSCCGRNLKLTISEYY